MAKTFTNTIETMKDEELARLLISRKFTEFIDTELTSVRAYAFNSAKNCFIYLPNLTTVGYAAFQTVTNGAVVLGITNANQAYLCGMWSSSVYCFPNLTKAIGSTFKTGANSTAILPNKTMCVLTYSANNSWEAKATYVPKSLLESYQADTNWSPISSRIFAIEDNEDILTWLDEHGVDYTPDE